MTTSCVSPSLTTTPVSLAVATLFFNVACASSTALTAWSCVVLAETDVGMSLVIVGVSAGVASGVDATTSVVGCVAGVVTSSAETLPGPNIATPKTIPHTRP
ncbi:hypothetical protein STPL106120_10775 [Streptococcus pluranimalium]